MRRPQALFAIVIVIAFGLVGVAIQAQAKAKANRLEAERLDKVNLVLVERLDSAIRASAPILAENAALVPVVAEAVEDLAENSERLVEESEAQRAVAVAVGGSFRSRLDSSMVPAFDSVISAERAVAATERERADTAEATVVKINAAYMVAQSALAHATSDLNLALMTIDSLSAASTLKDAIIAYQDNPPFLVKVWDALPEFGSGVAVVVVAACIWKC